MADAAKITNDFTNNSRNQRRIISTGSQELQRFMDQVKLRKKKHYNWRSSHKNNKLLVTKEEKLEPNTIFKPKLPKSFYLTKLRDWAEEIPIIGLLPEWENNILQLIPEIYKKQYPQHLTNLFEEITDNYINSMQQFAVRSTVKDD